jgi:hypothetical protein
MKVAFTSALAEAQPATDARRRNSPLGLREAPETVVRRAFPFPPLEIALPHRGERRQVILLIVRSAAKPRVSNDEEDRGRGQ